MSYTKEETSTGFCVNILSYVTSIQNFRVIHTKFQSDSITRRGARGLRSPKG